MARNLGLYPEIEKYLTETRGSTDSLRRFTQRHLSRVEYSEEENAEGEKSETSTDSLEAVKLQFQRVADPDDEAKYISNSMAALLVYTQGVPKSKIKDVVAPTFYEALKPDSILESVLFPLNIGSNTSAFVRAVITRINQAKKRIWVSEYLPGRGDEIRPERVAIEGWMRAHALVYDAIYERMKKCPDLEYKRLFRVPEPDIKKAKYYGVSYCKNITLAHIYRMKKEFKGRVELYAGPLRRPLSVVIIDDDILMRESYGYKYIDSGMSVDIDMLSVERVVVGSKLEGVFKKMLLSWKDMIDKPSTRIGLNPHNMLKGETLEFFSSETLKDMKAHAEWAKDNFETLEVYIKQGWEKTMDIVENWDKIKELKKK